MPVYITPPPRNPLTQLLAAIVGVLAMAGAFLFGLVALAVVAGIAAIIGIAAWWQGWRLRRQVQAGQASRGSAETRDAPRRRPARGTTIEAEYTVISRTNEES